MAQTSQGKFLFVIVVVLFWFGLVFDGDKEYAKILRSFGDLTVVLSTGPHFLFSESQTKMIITRSWWHTG